MNFYTLRKSWHQSLDPIYGPEEVGALADLVVSTLTGLDRTQLRVLNRPFSPAQLEEMENVRLRLLKQEPVQYILGHTEFYGLDLFVDQGVLIPRPETEELVAWILEDHNQDQRKAIDLCSGSGCIALALKDNRPAWEVSGLEYSKAALAVSRMNAETLKLDVNFFEDDLFQTDLKEQQFDIMVSNPPYVRLQEKSQMKPNVVEYEPQMALFVDDDDPLLFYKRLAVLAQDHLNPKGCLYLEINEYLSKELTELLDSLGFEVVLRKDSYLKDRMLRCQKKSN